jgi:hypothetical protein
MNLEIGTSNLADVGTTIPSSAFTEGKISVFRRLPELFPFKAPLLMAEAPRLFRFLSPLGLLTVPTAGELPL